MQPQKSIIGFIGLGVMGKPMSHNLIRAGYSLMVSDINPDPVNELIAAGAVKGNSPKHIGESCNLIFTMLPNSPEVEEVICGMDGVLEGARPGSIIIDMSSIDPMVAIRISKMASSKGVDMLDAPVSGGEPKAIDDTLSIMAGGKEEVFAKVEPVLMAMGASAVLIGDIGSGNICKLAKKSKSMDQN